MNCPNGVGDLITGKRLDHSPDYLFTKVAGAGWVPGARHPDIDQALEAIPAEVRVLRPAAVRPGADRAQTAG